MYLSGDVQLENIDGKKSTANLIRLKMLQCIYINLVVRGGALVETMTFNRRVVGSTPALSTTYGLWASPLPAVACALRRETPIQYPCCNRERLWVVEDLKGRYKNGRNEWMNELKIGQIWSYYNLL